MKKLMWAALLALPLLAVGQQRASAEGGCSGCVNLSGGFRLKLCYAGFLNCSCEPFPCCANPCGGCCGGGYADCTGNAPGPWYLYWPYGGGNVMTGPVVAGWTYDSNFQQPAPIYPYWPARAPVAAFAGTGFAPATYPTQAFQPVGYYPSYWYGR
jgi:hypothetical protein